MVPKMWRGVVLLVVVALACAALAQTAADTSVPRLIRFGGTISSVNSGTFGVTFALYKDQSGGAPLWLETQNVAVDANGRYTVALGANHTNGVPVDLFASGEARWLGVQPEGQAEQARVMLFSVPYAMKAGDAETLGGQPLSAFVMASSANGASPTTASTATAAAAGGIVALASPQGTGGNVTTTLGGTTNYLAKFTTPTNVENSSLVYDSGTAVGIGTTAPAATFHVVSTTTAAGIVDVYNNALTGVTFSTRAARGTPTVPAVVQAGDIIGGFTGKGWTGSGGFSGGRGALIIHANETWSGTAQSTYMQFNTTALGTAAQAERMRIDNAGNVGIGTTNPTALLEVNGAAKFDGLVTFAAGQTFPDFSGVLSGDVQGIQSNTQVIATHLFSPLPIAQGGTGIMAAPGNGQYLRGTNTGWTVSTIPASDLPWLSSTYVDLTSVQSNISGAKTFTAPLAVQTSSSEAVSGVTTSATGLNYGVYGQISSTTGAGVWGNAPTTGVSGTATGTGTTFGVYGSAINSSGCGNVGIGTNTPAQQLDVGYNANIGNNLTVGSTLTVGSNATVTGTLTAGPGGTGTPYAMAVIWGNALLKATPNVTGTQYVKAVDNSPAALYLFLPLPGNWADYVVVMTSISPGCSSDGAAEPLPGGGQGGPDLISITGNILGCSFNVVVFKF